MKNLKLTLVIVVSMLFLGIDNVNAQEKSVLIKGSISVYNAKITIIQPDNQILMQEYRKKEHPEESYFLLQLKTEMDKWLKQGYTLTESGISSTSEIVYTMFYVLTKKE